jgi:hypothetical protein
VHWLRHHFTQLGAYASHPAAFALVLGYGLAWFALSPATFEWHAIATLVLAHRRPEFPVEVIHHDLEHDDIVDSGLALLLPMTLGSSAHESGHAPEPLRKLTRYLVELALETGRPSGP